MTNDEQSMDDLKCLMEDCEDIRKDITKDLMLRAIKIFDDLSPEMRDYMMAQPAVIDFLKHAREYLDDGDVMEPDL